jgi:hypothetical protein
MDISTKELAKHLSIQSPMPCAQCGANRYTPEWSEHFDDCRVRHFWICEACDYKWCGRYGASPHASAVVAAGDVVWSCTTL